MLAAWIEAFPCGEPGSQDGLEQLICPALIAEQKAEFDLFDQIIRMTETQLGKLKGVTPSG